MKSYGIRIATNAARTVFVVLALTAVLGCAASGGAKKITIPWICEVEDFSFCVKFDPFSGYEQLPEEEKQTVKIKVCSLCAEFNRTRDTADRLSNDASLPASTREAWRSIKVSYDQVVKQCDAFVDKTGTCPHSP